MVSLKHPVRVFAAADRIPAQRPDFIGFGLTAVDCHIAFVLVLGRTITYIAFKFVTYLD